MKLDTIFSESNHTFPAKLTQEEHTFEAKFGEKLTVTYGEIPPNYGLVTYDNTKTITVS